MIKERIKAISGRIRETLNLSSKPEPEPKQRKRISTKLNRGHQYRIDLSLDDLKDAVDLARDPIQPNRQLLHAIYDLISRDSHLASQMRTAKNKVLSSHYHLEDKTGSIKQKETELIKTQWFDDFVNYVLDVEFWGHSLIEFGRLKNGLFEDVKLIPRENVLQEKGVVALNPYAYEGMDYRSNLTKLALVEVGDPYSLGILELAAREVIIINYTRTDWGQASEKYGMPLLKIRTDSQDDSEIDVMEQQAANFGSSGYIILNRQDDASILADTSEDRYKIYKEGILLAENNLSKLVNGQGATSDEKSYAGSAKVQERILSRYTVSRLRRAKNVINNKLLPFLIYWGYPFEGLKFQYGDLLKEKPEMETSISNEQSKELEERSNKKRQFIKTSEKTNTRQENSIFPFPNI